MKNMKKALSLFLALVMALSLLNLTALAAEQTCEACGGSGGALCTAEGCVNGKVTVASENDCETCGGDGLVTAAADVEGAEPTESACTAEGCVNGKVTAISETDCETCDGSGKVACGGCGGTGMVTASTPAPVCVCESKCGETGDPDCPVCGAENADLTACTGREPDSALTAAPAPLSTAAPAAVESAPAGTAAPEVPEDSGITTEGELRAAIEGNTAEVRLDSNITLASTLEISKSLTLDLGGYTLTGNNSDSVIKVTGTSTAFTLKNGTVTGGGDDNDAGGAGLLVYDGPSVELTGVTVTGNGGYGIYVGNFLQNTTITFGDGNMVYGNNTLNDYYTDFAAVGILAAVTINGLKKLNASTGGNYKHGEWEYSDAAPGGATEKPDYTADTLEVSTTGNLTSLGMTSKPADTKPVEPIDVTDLYVSADGSDTAAGTQDAPFATLAHAVDVAKDGAIIHVLTDLAMESFVNVNGKSVTITSDGGLFTVAKANTFNTTSDPNRSWYNPAMIEVHGGSVTLQNIIFGDSIKQNRNNVTPSIFKQATSKPADENGNLNVVQDGIISAYDADSTITLGSGAVLKNFAGLSAVKVENGTLVMADGSSISGGGSNANKENGGDGARGAVWLQNGKFKMNGGTISGVTGRAVMAEYECSTANIGGTISNITADGAKTWQGTNGVAIHLRGGSSATVSGTIDTVTGGILVDASAWDKTLPAGTFALEEGGTIKNCDSTGKDMICINPESHDTASALSIDGTITNCTAGNLIHFWNTNYGMTFGEKSVISGNTCAKVMYEGQSKNKDTVITISGTIEENGCSSDVYYGNQNGREIRVTGTAKLNSNTANSIFSFGANRRLVLDEGSEIKGNTISYVITIGGEGSTFTMDGGTISGNTASKSVFSFTSGSWQQCSTFVINSGTISGNAAPHVLMIANGGKIPGIYSYLLVPEFDNTVYFAKDGKTVTADPGTKLGNANDNQQKYAYTDMAPGNDPRSVANLNAAAKTYGLKDAFATMWAQNADDAAMTVTLPTTKIGLVTNEETGKLELGNVQVWDSAKSVYVLAQAVDEKGKPADGAEVFVIAATVKNGTISFKLPGNATGYALGLAQLDPNAQKGTLELKVDKDEVFQSGLPIELNYTATFTPKEGTTLTSAAYTLTVNGNTGTFANNQGTAAVTLDNSSFKAGENYNAVAVLTITMPDGMIYKVLSEKTVSTKMTGLRNYTVTFVSEGTTLSTVTVTEGGRATQPADPTREGYTFDGWYTEAEGGAVYDFDAPVTRNFTLYARWTQNDFTVTFNANGGAPMDPGSISVKPNTAAGALPMPTRDGYTFLDWNTRADGAGDAFTEATVVTESLTVYAQWKQNGAVGITANPTSLTGGGAVTLTVTTPDAANTTVTCNVPGVTLTKNVNGTYSVSLPNSTVTYTFTAALSSPAYTAASASCTVTVTRQTTGGGGGGGTGTGGGGGGRGTTTINEQPVPLAGDLQLNREDHFAYIKGYADGTVKPNNPITRAQAATIFYRLLTDTSREIYFQETNDFTDVSDSYWANKAISTLSNAGIINGFQDGTFRPDAHITRAQFTAMTARFEDVVPGLENAFTDVAEDHWARDQIAYAAFKGWITGGGAFRPQEDITRVEVMDMLNNVLDRKVDAQGLADNAVSWTDVKPGDPYYYVVMEATISHDWERRGKDQIVENWTELTEDPVWDE